MSAVLRPIYSNPRVEVEGLSPDDFKLWADSLQLSSDARRYIDEVRSSPPSRLVGLNGHWNRSGDYQSKKMMHSVQSESENAEWAYILILEFSKHCLEYYSQLPSVTVKNTYSNGRTASTPYRADFLVMMKDDVYAVECKTYSKIQQLLVERPTDWKVLENGYEYVPAKEAFAKLGLKHIVFSSEECTKAEVANRGLLIHARDSFNAVNDAIAQSVIKAFSSAACLRLSDLAAECGQEDLTPFFQLISRGVLHARIKKDFLIHASTAWIATEPRALEHLHLDGDRVSQDSIESIPLVKLPNQNAFARALHKLERLSDASTPLRSKRNFRKEIEQGKACGLSAVLSLAPDWPNCGNRTVRLNETQLSFFEGYFTGRYCKPVAKRIMAAYREYVLLATEAHPQFKPMGRDAFTDRIRSRKKETAAGHGGKRAEMAAAQPSEIEQQAVKATRALELAHIDHHLTDVFVRIISKGGKHYAARAWLTVMVDARTGAILAIWLSLRSPSRRSCAMAIRRCVKAYGRLPESIIADHGAEFESTYYLELLAYVHTHKRKRPVGNARYGSEAERLFGIFIDVFSSRLPGRVQTILNRRSVSRSHSAEEQALLSPEEFYECLQKFRDWYNTEYVAPHEDRPPQELHDSLMRTCGCSGTPVVYDHAFEIATAVEADFYKVDPNKGFHTDIGWFWHPKLAGLAMQRKKRIEAREEPEDPYRMYAVVDNQWVTCRNTKDANFVVKAIHERVGEAMRLLDGRTERRQAKRDADAKLTRVIIDTDEKVSLEPKTKIPQTEFTPPPNPFDRLRKRVVTKLVVTKRRKQA